MLAKFWRLRMINNTGQTMTFNDGAVIAIRTMPWKISSGDLVYGTVITEDLDFDAGRSIINGADVMDDASVVESVVVDNSSGLFFGINGTFTVTHDLDAAVGTVDLYLEFSDEDGNWPSDSDDFVITDLIIISRLDIDNSAVDKSRSKNFVYN